MKEFKSFPNTYFYDYSTAITGAPTQTLVDLSKVSLPTKVYAKILTDWNLANPDDKATYFEIKQRCN